MPDTGSGEDRLVARHFRPLATHPGALNLIDDAAVVSVPQGHDLVLKTDAIIGGVHCFPDDPADAVARKALRVNLSDLAAKGATPLDFLLSLALPLTSGTGGLSHSRPRSARMRKASAVRCSAATPTAHLGR